MRTALIFLRIAVAASLCVGSLLTARPTAAATEFKLASGTNKLAVGWSSVCAITTANDLFCWGDNGEEQLGSKKPTFSQSPRRISTQKWRAVFTESEGSGLSFCGIRWDTSAWCWGVTNRLNYTNQITGMKRVWPSGAKLVQIMHYNDGLCVATTANKLWCRLQGNSADASSWKVVSSGQIKAVNPIVGTSAYCLLLTSGTMKCWGGNSGQMPTGIGSPGLVKTPRTVPGGPYRQLAGRSCAVTTSDELQCWGSTDWSYRNALPSMATNDWLTTNGVRCRGGSLCVVVPTSVGSDTWKIFRQYGQECGIHTDGTLECMLSFSRVYHPEDALGGPISDSGQWSDVQASWHIGCASKSDLTLWCWGLNDFRTDTATGSREFGFDASDYLGSPTQVLLP